MDRAAVLAETPQARVRGAAVDFGKADDVASLVAYLCSPLAAATNGASGRVDGGVVRSIG